MNSLKFRSIGTWSRYVGYGRSVERQNPVTVSVVSVSGKQLASEVLTEAQNIRGEDPIDRD